MAKKPGGTKVGNFIRGAVKVAKTVLGKAGGFVSPANVISAVSSKNKAPTILKGTSTSNFNKSANIPIGGSTVSKITGGTLGGGANMVKPPTITRGSGGMSVVPKMSLTPPQFSPVSGVGTKKDGYVFTKNGWQADPTSPITSSDKFNEQIKTISKILETDKSGNNDAETVGTGGTPPMNRFTEPPYNDPDIAQTIAEAEAIAYKNEQMLADQKSQDQLTEKQVLQQREQTMMDKILGISKENPMEIQKDYEKYYEIQAQQKKIDSMNQSYNALVAARDTQIAEILGSPYGTMDFTNNRVAQIERNAAPKINELAANIKFETAILTENKALVRQAVDDYFKVQDRQIRVFEMYKDYYSDQIDKLDEKEKDAIDKSFQLARDNLASQRSMMLKIADIAWEPENRAAGINPFSDSMEEVTRKLASSGAGGLSQTAISTYAEQLKNGDIELSNIPDKYRTAVIEKMGTKTYKLKSKISAIRKIQLRNNGIDSAKLSEVESLLNQGYSIEEIISTNGEVMTARQKELLRKIVEEV